jgi:bacillithiol synthase
MNAGTSYLPFDQTGQLNHLALDYLKNDPFLDTFYAEKPGLENLLKAARMRNNAPVNRNVLAEVLRDQYTQSGIVDPAISQQINKLTLPNTFTVTTGQQTGILLGPAYTLMKILTTIKLSEQLNEQDEANCYIPVFWMATEDHDLEEIRHTWFREQKFSWSTNQKGPVGRFHTNGIIELIDGIRQIAGKESSMMQLLDLFRESYSGTTISQATRKIVHALFGHLGLLVIDPDDSRLKNSFSTIAGRDITEGNSFELVNRTALQLSARYHVQVNGRPVNFFWMDNGVRTRIEKTENTYRTVEGEKIWEKDALLEELVTHPERFSPNVIMRPLYQESILPNIAYIAGAAEIAYWMELKAVFDFYERPFPALLLRSSLTLIDPANNRRIDRLKLGLPEIFLPKDLLVNKFIRQRFGADFISEGDRKLLDPLFLLLQQKAENTASSKIASLKALQTRWENDLNHFNGKLLRYRKKLETEKINTLLKINSCIFPSGILQERVQGLADLVFVKGKDLLPAIHHAIKPLTPEMILIRS